MGTPAEYLPPPLSSIQVTELITSLALPRPTSVEELKVTAEYHSIYLVHFDADVADNLLPGSSRDQHDSPTLVLRVSGKHLPRIKTLNEVAVMRWVRENTTIPVPAVVRFDASSDNLVRHEFTLLEKARGVSVDKIYDSLDQSGKRKLVEQLADIIAQLHAKSWDHIGGLTLNDEGNIVPGPVLEETFWQAPDIEKYWPGETIETLNISGPWESYTAYLGAHLERYVYAINRHDSLAWLRGLTPRLQAFISVISSRPELNRIKHLLAHKDLHFANIMCDPQTLAITAILDWEFSGAAPAPRWDPVRAFLWNGQRNDRAAEEKKKMWAMMDDICRERRLTILEEVQATEGQQDMQTVANYVRALVEVGPRGQATDKVQSWREVVEETLSKFGL